MIGLGVAKSRHVVAVAVLENLSQTAIQLTLILHPKIALAWQKPTA